MAWIWPPLRLPQPNSHFEQYNNHFITSARIACAWRLHRTTVENRDRVTCGGQKKLPTAYVVSKG